MAKTRKNPLEKSGKIYIDPLYGEWDLPNIIKDLLETNLMMRLRGITMGVMPYHLYDWVTLPSRCHHGLGVARLAHEVLAKNPMDEKTSATILVSALLHDAGMPTLSHIPEKYLEILTGYNGESFLEFMLDYLHKKSGLSAKRVLDEYDIKIYDVMNFILGRQPINRIIHGSMDLDNIDNISRFWLLANLGKSLGYSPVSLAGQFVLHGKSWRLENDSTHDVSIWLQRRFEIYQKIYTVPHMAVAAMIRRAIYFAWCANELSVSGFFIEDDIGGLRYLEGQCGRLTRGLVNSLNKWRWYKEFIHLEFDNWPAELKKYAGSSFGDHILADEMAKSLNISPHQICVVMMEHNGPRKIDLLFADDAPVSLSVDESPRKYIFKLYVPENIYNDKIKELISLFVSFK